MPDRSAFVGSGLLSATACGDAGGATATHRALWPGAEGRGCSTKGLPTALKGRYQDLVCLVGRDEDLSI